jgi:hypothetical protein
MRALKQVVLFLLVIITIYSTMLFYLLMSVHADSRLQEIDFLEKSKLEPHNKVLYIDRIIPISERYLHLYQDSSISPSQKSAINSPKTPTATSSPGRHFFSSQLPPSIP